MKKPKAIEWLWTTAMSPISPKNLRMSAILIAIYQVLISHVIFFIMLLGVAHIEQVKTMLSIDIADQAECEYYELEPNAMNQVRLKAASELVSVTEVILSICTGASVIYVISCISLFWGVFKNQSAPIVPWLIVDFTGMVLMLVFMWTEGGKLIYLFGGKTQYWLLCIGFLIFEFTIWYIVHSFYMSVRQMRKLTEVATVAIPCPPPGSIPFHFRKENMYVGNSGYKHTLSDSDPNQKI